MSDVIQGIHSMVPNEKMSSAAKKLRDIYAIKPNAPIVLREFGFYCLEEWKEQGMPQDVPVNELFGFDEPGSFSLGGAGWCEAAFYPTFEEKIIEDRGEYEVVQDFAGRHVLCFKGRRSGFMPEYLKHPVTDLESWKSQCEWRMNSADHERYDDLGTRIEDAVNAAKQGKMIVQQVVGGYMYLRSLMGPEETLYMVYDNPKLIHILMEKWLEVADATTAFHQKHVTIDEFYIGEDICYNHGSLISPDMIKEFLFPYYQQLINNIKSRQIDKNRHLFFNVDTDGFAVPVIDLYKSIGMDVMNPFEVASYNDVVEIGRDHPDLVMFGGIDKRILAKGRDAIDKHIDYILPPMVKRGGYIPTCDHGVPTEVPYDDYVYFRERLKEFG